ncbi:MAG: tyrosine-type recombinase/integrase [Caldilineaceae bacterium]|nr:tyrosine-type recombinase/integrase [Caldilineaceae bacterium]
MDCQARRLRPGTIRYYRNELRPFLAFLTTTHSCENLQDVTSHLIRAYLVGLEDRGLKSASVHAAARAIRAFLNFSEREGLLTENPMSKVKMPRVERENLPAFTVEEVKELLAVASNRRDQAIILCLLDSGCRASEFLAWNLEDVNLTAGVVRVRAGASKGRKDRAVYLGTKARRALILLYAEQGGEPGDPVWRNSHSGERLQYEGLKTVFRRLKADTGISVHAHKFRRTFALWSLRAGMNIYALQRIMGHSDLTVLQRYLNLVEGDLKDAHDNFGAVDRNL